MKKYKISFLLNRLLVSNLFLFSLFSCSPRNFPAHTVYQITTKSKIPDYNNLNFWAAHPWKKDLSDSIPKPLLLGFEKDSLADVFFIHPTTLTAKKDTQWNADIDDAELNAKTDYSTILYQASVFNEKCRVFAPRYRQAHLRSFYEKTPESEMAFEIAYTDIKAAFLFYLKYLNNNQPIIIASHSQGTKHAARLLQEIFENQPLQKRLVCAYLIGMPVPDTFFTALKPCNDSLATGCFVSWRTVKSGTPDNFFNSTEMFNAVVINPLTWTNEKALISSKHNAGGVLKNFNKIVPRVVSSQVHNNFLWSSKPNVPGKILYTKKNYHIGDINLFYMNIRVNTITRINAYLKNR